MSQEIKKVDILKGLVEDYNTTKVANEEYNVAGCVHPLRPGMTAKGRVEPGTSVWDAVKEACKAAGVRESFMRRGVAQIGTRDLKNNVTVWRPISQALWKTRKLNDGELLRFRLLPAGGGGGGGKNPLRTILTIIVAVAAVAVSAMVGGWALGVSALTKMTATGITLNAAGTALVALSGLAVSTIGMVLVNAIAPIKAPTLGGLGSSATRDESQVYGLSAGQNPINQWGRVPVPLGRGRFAPPKAASPYTVNSGDDQYLHELLCIGIGDLEVSDIKIGTTAIEEFVDVEYEILKYDPKLQNSPRLYPTGVFQEDLNVQLKSWVWNSRTTAECDRAECDIAFQGLGYFNDQGGIDGVSVDFNVQYKLHGETDWNNVPAPYWVQGRSFVVDSLDAPYKEGVIAFNSSGYLSLFWNGDAVPSGYTLLQKVAAAKSEYTYWDYEDDDYGNYRRVKRTRVSYSISLRSGGIDRGRVSGLAVTAVQARAINGWRDIFDRNNYLRQYGIDIAYPRFQVSGGWYYPPTAWGSASLVVTYSGATSKLMRRTFTLQFPKRGIYDVRWQRRTEDSTNDRLRTDSFWTALRSISNDRPVQTDYPVNLLAIRAKATGQLSGSLGNVTVYYRSKSLDWDRGSKTWVNRFTSNPASLFRHVLQDRIAMARPQADAILDLDNLARAHEFWDDRGWEWNFVCDASVSVFERLQSICAAGLASPTMVDGRWGIIIDKERDHVACAFTSANSWGWTFERTQVRLPNEIHCNFISGVTWDTDMQRVATDEPIDGDIIYETQTYEGVNDPAQVYQLARFHYADAKNRRRTITLRCYDEALLCTRGDLVECACPNVSPHGLQVGRVRKVLTDENGYVTGFTTDQSNTTDFSGRRFGVRIYNSEGVIYHAEVVPENVTQTRLNFISPQQMNIANGDKYAFGDYSEEVFQAIVIGMQFNSEWTCDVTLQDYVPTLYGDLSQPIPPFYTTVTRPIESKWRLTSKPIIAKVVTDESVLLKNGATLNPRILVVISHPVDMDDRVQSMELDYRESGTEAWVNARKDVPLEDMNIYVDGVEEGKLYDVRVRYTNQIGFAGDYTFAEDIKVIGKTSLPPNVKNFTATIESPSGVRLKWDALDVLDIASYRISGDAQTEVVGNSTIVQVLRKTGTLSFSIVAVDTGGRVSKSATNATVEVRAPGTPDEIATETRTDGLYLTWDDCDTTWPVRHYNITDEYLNRTSKEMKTQFVVSPRAVGSYEIDVQAVDIFDNYGQRKSFSFVVRQPSTPQPKLEIANGVARVSWKAVSTSFPIKTYQVFDVNGQLLQETASTFYDINGPAGVLEYRIRAVDTAGNMSAFGEFVFELEPPEAPQVVVALNKNRDGLDITWNVPDSVLPVITYDVVRQWDETLDGGIIETKEQDYGSTDATALAVPAIPANTHTFLVRAVDASGNRSSWGTFDLAVRNPGPAFLTDVNVIDNNVMIYWQEPKEQFFAIQYYNFGTVEDGYFSLIGRIDARFASRFEKQAGSYTYQVCPVDVAGNIGQCSNITAQVAQPPDFVFFDDKDSTFNGTKVNSELDGVGNMIMGVYPNETWTENTDRVAALLNTSADTLTWQQKINGGYPVWQSPVASFRTVEFDGAIWANIFYHYLGSDGTNLFLDKNDAENCGDIGDDRYSRLIVLKNSESLFRQPDGKFEFLMFQSDETGPFTGDGSVYSRWKQTDNPMTTLYPNNGSETDPVAGFESVKKVGTAHPYGLALSSSPNTLLDGQPKHSHWYGAVGQVALYHGGTPALTNNLYSQLWVKIAPSLLTGYGSYVEIVDVGTLVPATSITVTTTSRVLEGSPILSCKIEVKGESEDDPWREMADGAFFTYATSFRYVRYTFTVTGGMLLLSNINYRLDVKKLSDFGSVYSKSTDNGAGFVDVDTTPMLYGTWVPFAVAFTDVQSGPIAFCNEQNKTAYVVFEDVLKPKGFRVFVLDKNGNRTSGQVSWSAHGV